MEANTLIGALVALLHILVLLFLFTFLFVKICTIHGRCKCIQSALLVAFFGVCTLLGSKVVPNVVFGLWVELGRLALILGWVAYIIFEARHARKYPFDVR